MTKVVLVLTYIDDCARSGLPVEPAVAKADELLGKAGRRINEALQYKSDCYQAAMMIAVIHHMRAVMHSGLLNIKYAAISPLPPSVKGALLWLGGA